MKTLHLKAAVAMLSMFALFATSSCNGRQQNSGIESDIENPSTSPDTVKGYKDRSTKDKDSLNDKNDSRRMSDGKDSIAGEVTPPNAAEQDKQ
jgi:hypothetical protein